MEPIQRVHYQLERCAEDYNQMIALEDIVQIEDTWHDFLTHIDRFWNLADRFFAQFEGWREFRQPFLDARNDDELLNYLVVARNTVEHTIQEVQVRTATDIRIEPGEHGGTIRNLRIFEDGSHTAETHDSGGREGPGPVVSYRMKICLRPVQVADRRRANEVVNPPSRHRGKPIEPDAFLVARLSFEYYREFFTTACGKFLSPEAT